MGLDHDHAGAKRSQLRNADNTQQQVPAQLETDKIEANLKDGVLTVRIPKRAQMRARKIEIQAH